MMSGTTTALPCGACGQSNVAEAQFCVGCGHSLYEPCPKCQASVSLVQKFCVGCGTDLEAVRAEKRSGLERQLAEAVAMTKSLEFDRAIGKLQPVADQSDFRLRDLAKRAADAARKIQQIRDRAIADARANMDAAAAAASRQELATAVTILRRVPPPLLDDAARQTLASSETHITQLQSAKAELKNALGIKDYESAAGWVAQILELNPEDTKAAALSLQIRDKLLQQATKRFARSDYEAALTALQSLPSSVREQPEVTDIERRYRRALFLSVQPDVEPQITPTLGRLAMRWQKECPSDGRATLAVEQLGEAIRRPRTDAQDAARWNKRPPSGWAGATVHLFDQPSSLSISVDDAKPRGAEDLAAAIGLALAAVGRARIDGNLILPKGLASKLTSRPRTAWGIDVGSTELRAVKIELLKGQDKPVITSVVRVPIDPPAGRLGSESDQPRALSDAVAKLKAEVNLEKQVIWANLAADQTISRFVELPPVADKKADPLIQAEIRGRIPIPIEDLRMITWRAPFDAKHPASRPAVLAAVRTAAVSRRTDQLAIAGLKVTGLQPDPIATVNFLSFEFAEKFRSPPATSDKAPVKTATTPEPQPPPGILAIDAGAQRTTWFMVSEREVWYWSHEAGGEAVTTATARQLKQTLDVAEQTKRNLAAVDWPDELDAEIAKADGKLRIRLQRLDDERRSNYPRTRLNDLWVLGRAARQYGFVRRVLLS